MESGEKSDIKPYAGGDYCRRDADNGGWQQVTFKSFSGLMAMCLLCSRAVEKPLSFTHYTRSYVANPDGLRPDFAVPRLCS